MIVLLIILLCIISIILYYIQNKNKEISKYKNSINDLSQRIELINDSYDKLLQEKAKLDKRVKEFTCHDNKSHNYRVYFSNDLGKNSIADVKDVVEIGITNNEYILYDNLGKILSIIKKEDLLFLERRDNSK